MNLKIYFINLINMSGIYDYIVQSFYKKESITLNDNKTILNDNKTVLNDNKTILNDNKTILNESNSSEINEIVKINYKEINQSNENLSMNDFFKSASYIIAYMMDDYSTTLVDVVS